MDRLYEAAGSVKRGIARLDNPADFKQSLSLWPDGPITFSVRPYRRQRSIDQNKYLHAVVFPMIASEVGDSVEGVKFDLMGEKWGWTKTANGHDIPVKPHTADMKVDECTEFIDWVIPWAAQKLNIRIPLPNEAPDDAA